MHVAAAVLRKRHMEDLVLIDALLRAGSRHSGRKAIVGVPLLESAL